MELIYEIVVTFLIGGYVGGNATLVYLSFVDRGFKLAFPTRIQRLGYRVVVALFGVPLILYLKAVE